MRKSEMNSKKKEEGKKKRKRGKIVGLDPFYNSFWYKNSTL